MTEFQDLAARLIEMKELRLIDSLLTQTREIAGVEYYDLLMVTGGGLTDEGRRVLATGSSAEHG